MKTQDLFYPDATRSNLDSGICSSKRGFAQLDTKQDTSYFGMWANPVTLQIVTFAEGDLKIQTAETDTEFINEIHKIKRFYNKYSGFLGIDPGWNPEPLTSTFRQLGLGNLLH